MSDDELTHSELVSMVADDDFGPIRYSGHNSFKHYGILRKSGRFPWGSGGDAYQRSMDFYSYLKSMSDQGLTDREIAIGIGEASPDGTKFSVADLRDTRTIAKEQIVLEQTNRAVALKEKDWSIQAIADNLGIPAPTVRLRLKNSENLKASALRNTAEVLRKNVDTYDIVDVGKGVSHQLQISPERLRAAASVLRDEGYETYNLQVRNVGTKHSSNHLVMVPPGTGFGNAKRMADRIHTMGEFSEDKGLTFFGLHPPVSISSSRLGIVYKEDGGADRDGHVFIRPDAPGLDMGKNTYAQVRIMVDNTHFIKGMAIKTNDLPDGVDMLFHTNKSRTDPKIQAEGKLGALKPLTPDKDNPFGSIIKRQIVEVDPKTGKERAKSALNFVNEEGDWDWRESLPSQMLAKQPHALIKSQLSNTRKETVDRLAEINSITNAIVRRKKLEDFADQIDADAVDLRAAAMPHQRTQVIISDPKLRPNEIYAPNFKTGEPVVLIRYPHGGVFEIPEVVVNNNVRSSKKLIGNATDAITVHPKVAERLSGADFDGDTVVVIPNKSGAIKGSESIGRAKAYYEQEFNNFNAKEKYGGYEVVGKKVNKKTGKEEDIGNFSLMKNTGKEMGVITNLITDMSIQGAKPEHVVRAVRHSMVVIDAEKHKLNYKQSKIDNGIDQLVKLYQATPQPDGSVKYGGASTLLSKATATQRIPQEKLRSARDGGPIDKETGALVYVPTGKTNNKYDPKTQTYTDEKVPVLEEKKRLALTPDAYSLVRDANDPIEKMYADHANGMKALANEARLMASRTKNPPVNDAAKVVYKDEVARLVADLKRAEAQKPLERRANVLSGALVKQKRLEDPLLRTDRDRLEKVERQAKAAARARLGLERPVIEIDDRQWDAIQSGAVSANRLKGILEYAKPERVEELSMPRTNTVMTSAISSRARAMLAAGATSADIAASLGISASTLREAIRRGDV